MRAENTGGSTLPVPTPTTGPVGTAYIVLQVAVAAWLGQQQLDDLHVPMFTGTHQGSGALIILDVDIGPTGQQALHHVYPPMTDCQHEGRLPRLWEGMVATSEVQKELAGRGKGLRTVP